MNETSDVKLSVMVPPDLRDRLKRLADKADRSVGKHAARVLREYVEKAEADEA